MNRYSTDTCRLAANQLAPALRCTSFDGNRNAVDGKGLRSSDNLVDPVRLASRVSLRTVDSIPEPCNRAATNVMVRRTADDGSAVIGYITYRDYF